MKYIYSFFGGRRIYHFHLLLIVNAWALYLDKWIPEFGYFSIGLYTVIVLGIQSSKYIKGKIEQNREK